jgi:hypothetical protein
MGDITLMKRFQSCLSLHLSKTLVIHKVGILAGTRKRENTPFLLSYDLGSPVPPPPLLTSTIGEGVSVLEF